MDAALAKVESTGQLASLLTAYLSIAGAKGDPYPAFRAQLRDAVVQPPSAAAQPLYALAGALAILDVLIMSAVWFIRWRKHTFWLIRRGYIWGLYRLAAQKAAPSVVFWTTLSWLPGLVAIVVNCWVLSTTFVVQGISAGAVVALLATTLPLSAKAGIAYRSVIERWQEADGRLGQASQESSSPASVAAAIAPMLFELLSQRSSLFYWFRWTFAALSIWAFSLGTVFCALGVVYVRALKRSLDEFRDKSPTASTVFARTLKDLIALLAGFTFFLTTVAVNSIWVCVLTKQALSHGQTTELSALIPLFAAISGTFLIALTMLYQALSAPPVYANAPARNGSLLRARARSGSHPRSPEYSIHYAQFALAASEYFPEVGGTADAVTVVSLTNQEEGEDEKY
ncbi:hypothetical protein JCM8202v2_005397 [Rhodotorula sphaerocarpa]